MRQWHRLLIILTVSSVLVLLLIPLNPVGRKILRLAFLTALIGVWLGPLLLLWKHKLIRWIVLVIPVMGALPFVLPGRPIDAMVLRDQYLNRMAQLEGTRYYWGGESPRGIDCSGLPRRALRDALFSYGLRYANGDAFRLFAEQWWYDTSAEALGQGYRSFTVDLQTAGTIETIDYTALEPGDLAVTADSIHLLVYFGEGQWIQADPHLGEVAILHGHEQENSWFSAPVTLHRWRIFERS